MNYLKIPHALAVLAAVAGATASTARAEFIVTGNGQVDSQYFFISPMFPDFAFDQQEIQFSEPLAFDLSWNLDSSTHGSVDSWTSTYTGEVAYTSDSFRIDAASHIEGLLNEPISSSNGNSQMQNNMGYSADIEVTEETLATISFEGFMSALTNTGSRTRLAVTVSTLLGSFADFSAGFGADVQIMDPFSFDATLLEGEVITVQFVYDNDIEESDEEQIAFEQSLGGAISITAVPAPGSAAIVGLGGLMALRRNRQR